VTGKAEFTRGPCACQGSQSNCRIDCESSAFILHLLCEEASDTLKEDATPAVMDALIIGGGQRAAHYEIAAYGTVIAWARILELKEIAGLLAQTLEEEKAADRTLSRLADAGINEAAMEEEAGQEADDRAEPAAAGAPRSAPHKRT
jgi:ferritin-like metal-binding protein YciE